jgi:hypothetical protein
MFLAPALLLHGGKNHHENLQKSLATLDIGSHSSNAAPQPLPKAGARDERTLEAVSCTSLILIEAPSSADHHGTAGVGSTRDNSGGDLRRFSTPPHQCDGGSARHARRLSLGILHHAGAIRAHRQRPAAPDPWLHAMAPARAELGVGVAGRCTWDLARRPLRPGRSGLRPGPRALPAGHARGPRHPRDDRRAAEGGAAPWGQAAPRGCRARGPAGHAGSAPAPAAAAAHTGGVAGPSSPDASPVDPARDRPAARRHRDPAGGGGAVSRACRPHAPRRGSRAAGPRRRAAPRRGAGPPQHGSGAPPPPARSAPADPRHRRAPARGAARCHPRPPALPRRARVRGLRPRRHVCQGSRGDA